MGGGGAEKKRKKLVYLRSPRGMETSSKKQTTQLEIETSSFYIYFKPWLLCAWRFTCAAAEVRNLARRTWTRDGFDRLSSNYNFNNYILHNFHCPNDGRQNSDCLNLRNAHSSKRPLQLNGPNERPLK